MKIYVKSSASVRDVSDLSSYGPCKGYHDKYEDTFDMDEDTEQFLYSAAYTIFEDVSEDGQGCADEFQYLSVRGRATIDGMNYTFSINVGDILSDIERLRSKLRDYDKAEEFWYKHIEPMYVKYYSNPDNLDW
jgi:hypothetical protein